VASCEFSRLIPAFMLPFLVTATGAYSQENKPATSASSSAEHSNGEKPPNQENKTDRRVFGVLPNYRSVDPSAPFQPIGTGQKFTLAAKDSFDWPLLFIAGGYAGLGQLINQNPSLKQGTTGYLNRYVRSVSDLAIANLMTEGVMASFLVQDPRYFRHGDGRFWTRTGYAASRIFATRTDSGATRFNFAEVCGNSVAVGISNLYYPDARGVGDFFGKLTVQLATDAFSNILKEFWPDVARKLSERHRRKAPQGHSAHR
jgi:hypothetical protein